MKYIRELLLEHNTRKISQLDESQRLHYSEGNPKKLTARQVADQVFMDLIALWILNNIYEFAPKSERYAMRTLNGANRFERWKITNSDLYNSLHMVIAKRTDLLSKMADKTLLKKIRVNVQEIRRYLNEIKTGKLREVNCRMLLQRFETQLKIENSNYKSIRRLAQDWNRLMTSQKRQVVTRMLFFYNSNARTCEMHYLMKDLAKKHNFKDRKAKDPEKSTMKKAATAAAAATAATGAGFYAGWKLGKSIW